MRYQIYTYIRHAANILKCFGNLQTISIFQKGLLQKNLPVRINENKGNALQKPTPSLAFKFKFHIMICCLKKKTKKKNAFSTIMFYLCQRPPCIFLLSMLNRLGVSPSSIPNHLNQQLFLFPVIAVIFFYITLLTICKLPTVSI